MVHKLTNFIQYILFEFDRNYYSASYGLFLCIPSYNFNDFYELVIERYIFCSANTQLFMLKRSSLRSKSYLRISCQNIVSQNSIYVYVCGRGQFTKKNE